MTMTPSLQSGGFPSTTTRTLLSTPSTSRPRMSLAGSPIEFIAAAYLTPDSPFLIIISGQARLLLQHGLPAPISLPRADNNLPPWRPSLKEKCHIFEICIYKAQLGRDNF